MNSILESPEIFFPEQVQQIKLIGSRSGSEVSADFRMNYQDFLPAKAALEHYVATWVSKPIEMRKHLVMIVPIEYAV